MPRISWSNGEFLVVASQYTPDGGSSWLQRVSPTGQPQGAALHFFADGFTLVGLDLDEQWVVAATRSQLTGWRILADGGLGPAVVMLTGASSMIAPRITESGGRHLVVTGSQGGATTGLVAVLIEADGGVGAPSSLRPSVPTHVSVAPTATGWVVGFANTTDGRLGRFEHSGGWVDGVGVIVNPSSDGEFSVAAGDAGVLAVYGRNNTSRYHARLLTPALSLLGSELSLSAVTRSLWVHPFGLPDVPEVAVDDTSFIVVYSEDSRDGGTLELLQRRIFFDGGLGAASIVAAGLGDQFAPDISVGSPGRLGVVLTTLDSVAGATAIAVRTSASLPEFAQCLSSNECAVGVCAQVCCRPGLTCPDAGVDAGATDAGVDAGSTDAGADAGMADAGVDAGTTDAGVDAGTTDAGVLDGGAYTNDAGVLDGGAYTNDAGVLDGGFQSADAGVSELAFAIGCDCGAGSSIDSTLLLLSMLCLRRSRPPSQ